MTRKAVGSDAITLSLSARAMVAPAVIMTRFNRVNNESVLFTIPSTFLSDIVSKSAPVT
jgi:hypothetical protein